MIDKKNRYINKNDWINFNLEGFKHVLKKKNISHEDCTRNVC
jgi:hypothetical protein